MENDDDREKTQQTFLEQLKNIAPESLENFREGLYDEILGRNFIPRLESLSYGKALRKKFPRSKQGVWEVERERTKGIELLREQEERRLPELLKIRHQRMAASSFAFYRGAATIMADDLSKTPTTGIIVQTCGDAHISNFGMFQSPERNLVFDINDFDETLPGPWEWDLKRLLTSIEVCGRDRHFTRKQRDEAVLTAARTYRESMRYFSEMGNLEVWYAHMDIGRLYEANKTSMGNEAAEAVHKAIDKAFSKNNDKAIAKLTETVNGKLRIKSDPPLVVPIREMNTTNKEEQLRWMARSRIEYRNSLPRERRSLIDQYQVVDIARKVVGVGSVGTRDWIMVLQGRENGDYLVLQMKEANASVMEEYVGKSRFISHARRVVEGQRAIQTAGDIMLGWARMVNEDNKSEDYYVRQLWDGKGSIDIEHISADGLTGVATLCAWVLAHAHAKTGNRHAIAGYLGKGDHYDKAMLQFAKSYADQSEADYQRFLKMIKDEQ